MYAVIKAGGKQQRVKPGDVIEVEYMHGLGETVTFQPLLVVDDDGKTHYGKDAEKAVVTAKPLGEQKGEKVRVFKYKNKTGYARAQGHRQTLTLLEISEVSLSGTAKPSVKPAQKPAAKTAKRKPAATKAAAEGADEESAEA